MPTVVSGRVEEASEACMQQSWFGGLIGTAARRWKEAILGQCVASVITDRDICASL